VRPFLQRCLFALFLEFPGFALCFLGWVTLLHSSITICRDENILRPILAGALGLAVYSVGFLMQRCSTILAFQGQHPTRQSIIEAILELLKIDLFLAGMWCAIGAVIFLVIGRWTSFQVSFGLSAMWFAASLVVWRSIMRSAKCHEKR